MAPRIASAATNLLVLLLVILIVNFGNNGCQGSHRETAILHGWLNQIEDPQASLKDWESSSLSSPCDWTGIRCNNFLEVSQIDLSNMGLSGVLSPVLGQLQMLTVFNISGNNFIGEVPPEICSCQDLQVFVLHRNSFAGAISSCLSQLKQLQVMDFSYNLFDSLPESIGMFPQLSVLNFEGCALKGTIPSAIGNITTLTSLSLGGNELTGFIPPQLNQLWRLQRMHLGYNYLIGQVPPMLGMISLRYLNLAENNLIGIIPWTLWNLVHLEEVYLFDNYLSGAIPATIGNATGLISLDISSNSLNGSIPQTIGTLKSLEFLNLTKNEIVGQIPPALSSLPGLQVLSLSLNQLTGGIPEGFGVLSNISTLDLSFNQLVSYIPHGLCSFGGLSVLDLSSNFLYESIPTDLQTCSSLRRINVANNGLVGTLDGIGALPLLSYLDVSSNKLSGSLESAQFSNAAARLVELYLQNNQFINSLPECIGLLPKLGTLDVSRNNLSGNIPPQLGDCAQLSRLILEGNYFSGSIPQQITNGKQLQVVNLSWNNLSGPIPVDFSSLRAMEALDLSHNLLNGSIPMALTNCSSLQYLDLSYNNFSGPVPVEGVFNNISDIFLAGNKYLCGGLVKFHLPLCPKDSTLMAVKILTGVLVGLSVLIAVIAFWWQGRNMGSFHDMKETTPEEAGGAGVTGEREISICDPEMESVGVLREEEMRVFHSGDADTVLDERNEGTVLFPYNSTSPAATPLYQTWQPPPRNWKVVSLVPALDLTADEVLHTCDPPKLIGTARSAEMYAGVTKSGLQFVVERQLRPANGENLSIVLRKLGQCNHPHIVKVFGYCLDGDSSLVAVIYEHMAGGNLREAIESGRLRQRPHKWGCRFDIALGIVRALHYLHENQPTYAPRRHQVDLSELDLARPESSRASSASDKMLSSSCTDGTDIYDLGVVLLEILSGRPVKAPNGMTIVEWFDGCLEMESGVQDMLDPTLGGHMSREAFNQIESLFNLASRCLATKSEERPTLNEVLMYLLRISKPSAAVDRGAKVWLRHPSRLSRSSTSDATS